MKVALPDYIHGDELARKIELTCQQLGYTVQTTPHTYKRYAPGSVHVEEKEQRRDIDITIDLPNGGKLFLQHRPTPYTDADKVGYREVDLDVQVEGPPIKRLPKKLGELIAVIMSWRNVDLNRGELPHEVRQTLETFIGGLYQNMQTS